MSDDDNNHLGTILENVDAETHKFIELLGPLRADHESDYIFINLYNSLFYEAFKNVSIFHMNICTFFAYCDSMTGLLRSLEQAPDLLCYPKRG